MVLPCLLRKCSPHVLGLALLLKSVPAWAYAPTSQPSDAYIEGYAQAVMETHYALSPHHIGVKGGILYFTLSPHAKAHPALSTEKLLSALKHIRGVNQVVLLSSPAKAPAGAPKLLAQEVELSGGAMAAAPSPATSAAASSPPPVVPDKFTDGFMVSPSIFKPLIADPRWPRFSLAYHNFLTSSLATHVFAPNFGATLPFYRYTMKNGSQLEAGVQAALFAIMDIGHTPSALINADYVGGGFAALTQGPWAHMVRLFHLSSHLGDEFMLTPEGKRTKRVNLSYETLSYIISHEQANGVRLYGGGGYKVHAEPSAVKPMHLQGGVEYRHAHAYWNNQVRPVGGIDMMLTQQAAWRPNTSVKVGLQLENALLHKHVTQLMLEYYQGRSMHGQFYAQPLRYIGIGLHVFL